MKKQKALYWGSEIKSYFSGVPVEYCCDGKTWHILTDANLFNNEKYAFRIKPSSSIHTKKILYVNKDGTVGLTRSEEDNFANVIIWMLDGEVDYLEIVK